MQLPQCQAKSLCMTARGLLGLSGSSQTNPLKEKKPSPIEITDQKLVNVKNELAKIVNLSGEV